MFKPGFFGKNPTRWFIGQVPLNQVENKRNEDRWGDRVKVRIVGYHPYEGNLLKDEDLPWAIVLKPNSQGSLNKGSTAIAGGEWVIGIFLDDDYEKPLIIGVLGRSDPSYDITGTTVQQNQSSEFKKTLNYFGEIKPQVFQTKAGETPSINEELTIPSLADFNLKPD